MKKLAFAVFLLSATAAYADTACERPQNDFDGLYCLNKIYQEADKELNESYKKLTAKLDSSGKAALRTSQLAWIEQRNADCSRREGNKFFVNMDCATDTTVARTRFLQDRLRECNSTGCQNSKL
ncbi:MAG: lysozyme inhibitor LprI family protein [Rhodospirillales bacterium]